MWFMVHKWLGRQIVDSTAPRVWALLNHRTGENSQVLALAEALGWPFEVKRFIYRRGVPYLLLGASLAGIHRHRSDPLAPPWPDLIISASARNEPICRWIQRQAARQQGHRVRLVHIGRPWNRLDRFDLVITTPQYRLPERANVLHNSTTLHRVTSERLQAERRRWQARFAHLRRPLIAVMIGGSSGPNVMDKAAARQLAGEVNALAKQRGGSLLVTTSARTPRGILETFAEGIAVPAHLFRWTPDCPENPYYAYLALAAEIVVTSDSVSMMTEACATGKPVHVFDLAQVKRHPLQWSVARFQGLVYRWAMDWLPKRLTRDLSLVHQRMIDEGHAVWLEHPYPSSNSGGFPTDMERAVARVQALFCKSAQTLTQLHPAFS